MVHGPPPHGHFGKGLQDVIKQDSGRMMGPILSTKIEKFRLNKVKNKCFFALCLEMLSMCLIERIYSEAEFLVILCTQVFI